MSTDDSWLESVSRPWWLIWLFGRSQRWLVVLMLAEKAGQSGTLNMFPLIVPGHTLTKWGQALSCQNVTSGLCVMKGMAWGLRTCLCAWRHSFNHWQTPTVSYYTRHHYWSTTESVDMSNRGLRGSFSPLAVHPSGNSYQYQWQAQSSHMCLMVSVLASGHQNSWLTPGYINPASACC